MGPELYGSEGMAFCDLTKEGVVVKVNDFYGHQTVLPPLQPLPHMRNVTTAIAHHLETGEPLPGFLDMDVNIEVLGILDAGVKSASSGKLEVIRDTTWEIG
jgi:hypothetical protein